MATFATFNGVKSSNVTLSNGNLTATKNGSPNNWGLWSADQHKTTGKWYFEIHIDVNSNSILGIANSSYDFSQTNVVFAGDTNSWAFESSAGLKAHTSGWEAYGTSWTTGDIISFAVDVDGGTITMYINGVSQGVMYNTGLPADIYFGFNQNTSPGAMTANFGASAFTYSVPSGYNPGLYTGTITPPQNSNFLLFM